MLHKITVMLILDRESQGLSAFMIVLYVKLKKQVIHWPVQSLLNMYQRPILQYNAVTFSLISTSFFKKSVHM